MTVLQTVSTSPQTRNPQDTCDDAENRLASCLAFLSAKSPDLALLVQRWDTLPDALRAGILAMVKASANARG